MLFVVGCRAGQPTSDTLSRHDCILGEAADVRTVLPRVEVEVNGGKDPRRLPRRHANVLVRSGGVPVMKFSWDCGGRLLPLAGLTVIRKEYGQALTTAAVAGLEEAIGDVTLYLRNLGPYVSACVSTRPLADLDRFSLSCGLPGELQVPCPGARDGWRCSLHDDLLEVSGPRISHVSAARVRRPVVVHLAYGSRFPPCTFANDYAPCCFGEPGGCLPCIGSPPSDLCFPECGVLGSQDCPPEQCDGQDNDEDGDVDEDLGGEPCGTTDVGECEFGETRCVCGVRWPTCTPLPFCLLWQPVAKVCSLRCEGATEPSNEVCDGVDNDCDGEINEDLGTTTCGVGACERTVTNCLGGTPQTCTPGPPSAEVCDRGDNDCDGEINEDLGITTCGVGACERTVNNCVEGVPQTCIPGEPSSEICDGVDNDCNPATADGADEPEFGTPCDGADTDLCPEGEMVCSDNSLECSDAATENDVEICDGVDNDCNPVTADGADEPEFGTPCDGADTDLCPEGEMVCSDDSLECSDATGDSVETCNGADDDCDADIDEDNACCGNDTCETGLGERCGTCDDCSCDICRQADLMYEIPGDGCTLESQDDCVGRLYCLEFERLQDVWPATLLGPFDDLPGFALSESDRALLKYCCANVRECPGVECGIPGGVTMFCLPEGPVCSYDYLCIIAGNCCQGCYVSELRCPECCEGDYFTGCLECNERGCN